MKYDAFEVHPVAEYTGKDGQTYCEVCEESEAHFWSVYGHLPEGGIECLADYRTREFAEEIQQLFLQGLLAQKVQEPIPVVITVEGGVVSSIYSPETRYQLHELVVDYDLEDGGKEGLEDLIERLEAVLQLEKAHDYPDTVAPVLYEMQEKLKAITREASR